MVADRLMQVRERVVAAAARVGREGFAVRIVVVSKGRSDAAVRAAYDAGQRDFAENRAEQLAARVDGDLPSDIRWHFVGTVQRRKIRVIAPAIDMLHSLDRDSVATAFGKEPTPPPVLLQVNVGEEPQKFGYLPGDLPRAATFAAEAGLVVAGLMVIPPRPERPEDSRRWFEKTQRLQSNLVRQVPAATELSMGMSDDFEVAVECGATIVRPGRAIFSPGGTDTDLVSDEPR